MPKNWKKTNKKIAVISVEIKKNEKIIEYG
jgi:hypothetical protein